ncbi:protein TRANSPARENT TESTA 12-like [Hibiscus syriacus]|uniref:Protein TRANSPARENT TESTA 12-like n=1 Tax=Hibiscus syriacus TaxID=106335 RepID=A0A6A3C5E1_HIBSY|nr:protein TRANSPARENT TESTA 12-like [Hibiscus syriacus]
MASGHSAGRPDFYAGIEGRSVENTGAVIDNQPTAPCRTQIPGIVVDPASQIVNRAAPNLIGKRTLADFEKQQFQYNHLGRNNLYLRSVKPRTNYQHSSSIYPLSPIGFSSNLSPDVMGALIQGDQQQDPEKMTNQLHELEKQLFEDEDDGEGDAPINLVAPSRTSSTTSSSSSTSSVASPASACSKQTIMEAASAISEGKTDVGKEILTRLVQVGNAKGNSEQRLVACMLLALKSRVNSVENAPPVAELFSKEHATATQLLYDLSPCFKLGFLAANLAILDATFEQPCCSKLHVIDFDIGQGGQYKNLFHALSERGSVKPTLVKITAIADNGGDDGLKMVGDKLSQIAERVGVCMKFNVVTGLKLSDLTRESLGCEADELLAINFAFKLYRMPDESVCVENPRDELLRRVKGLAPRVVTLVEQEMNTNTAPFASRVAEASAYYGALFESIESTVSRENSERATLEEGLYRKIANSVSCEGRERVERCEVFGKWRARMSMAGFELKPLNQSVAESMRGRLNGGNRVNPGFTVKEENGAVCFGWMNRTLTSASAWR